MTTARLLGDCIDNGAPVSATEAILLKLAPGALPFMLDGRPVVFSERNQELLELNESAAALIVRLAEPVLLDAFRQDLRKSLPGRPDEADRLINDWSDRGIISASIDWEHPYFRLGSAVHLTLGGACAEIGFGSDPFGQSLAAAFGHLRQDGHADIRVATVPAGDLAIIQIEGRPATIVPKRDAASELRACLVELLLERSNLVALHAACLVENCEAILLTGRPGSGKSTLAAALSARRWTCTSDDIVLFDPIRRAVKGIPLPLTIKEGAWRMIANSRPEIMDFPAVTRRDGQRVRYLPLSSVQGDDWMPVRAIVELHREDGAKPSLDPLSKIDCLRKLCSEAHVKSGRCTPQILGAMSTLVDRADALQLCYDEARHAASLLEQFFGL